MLVGPPQASHSSPVAVTAYLNAYPSPVKYCAAGHLTRAGAEDQLDFTAPQFSRTLTRPLGSEPMSIRHSIFPPHGALNKSATWNSGVHSQRHLRVSQSSQRWVIWLAVIGIFLPYTVGETGKYIIAIFFLPAILAFIKFLIQGKRRVTACDVFVWVAAIWMLAVKIGTDALFGTASDAFAFVGTYMLARSFIYDEPSLKEFMRALKFVAVALIALSVLDTLTGTFFIKEIITKFIPDSRAVRTENLQIHRSILGITVLRAASTFGHPILFGTFCSIAGVLFYASERAGKRIFYCACCLIGCVLSVSSGPLLGLSLGISLVTYNQLLRAYPPRWKILWLVLIAFLCVVFSISNNPVTWVFRNLTVDPVTGYFRLLIWDHAASYIALSPIIGGDPLSWATDEILGDTIDSVWLVLSLLYGLPMVAFLLLASLSACGVFGRKFNSRLIKYDILQIRTAFSVVLFLYAILGLSVHFWGSIWMLWGLCIGIRASLEEYCLAKSRAGSDGFSASKSGAYARGGLPSGGPDSGLHPVRLTPG